MPLRLVGVRLVALGAAATSLQILVMRELLSAFHGNEAVLASFFGPWLLLTALGTTLGRRWAPVRAEPLLFLVGASTAATLFAVRVLPRFFTLGTAPGTTATSIIAGLLLAPSCLMAGACFSRLAGQPGANRPAYFLESVGATVAGAALSVALLDLFDPFHLAAGVAALTTLAAVPGASRRTKVALAAGGTVIVLPLLVLPWNLWTVAWQSPHLSVQEVRSSAHGSIVVAGSASEPSLFIDRVPALTRSEQAVAEELVHLPLALHPSPKRITLVGLGPVDLAGLARMHGVAEVDWVIEDRVVEEVITKWYPQFRRGRPNVVVDDARRFFLERPGHYDAVLLVSPEPTTARLNRFFTVEFFEAVGRALSPQGVFSASLPGQSAFASTETRRLHSSVRSTLEAVFPTVQVFPLERTFYVSRGQAHSRPAPNAPQEISGTLTARQVVPAHLTPGTLAALASPARVADAVRWASLNVPLNRDLEPSTYRIAVDRLLLEYEDRGLWLVTLLAVALGGVALVAFGPRARPVELSVFTTGVTSLASQLLIMLAYQVAFGALYKEVGLLSAGFMLGAAGGAALGLKLPAGRRWLVGADLVQFLFLAALWQALPHWIVPGAPAAKGLLIFASVSAGLLPGAQFSLAVRRLEGWQIPNPGGLLYAADLAGAALAALLTYTVVVPLLGVAEAFLAIGVLKISSGLLLALPERPLPRQALARPRVPYLPVVFVCFLVLAVGGDTNQLLYSLTFDRTYQGGAVVLLVASALAALEPSWFRALGVRISRALIGLRSLSGATLGRILHFGWLLPVAAFPLARCYFAIPFVFCHVCPRPCVFGALRPYAIPAALFANLQGQRFCERICPLGTIQGSCERLRPRRARRIAWLWVFRLALLPVVAAIYFAAKSGRADGVEGGALFAFFFKNAFSPSLWVLGATAALLGLSAFIRRPFCDALCPVGAASRLLWRAEPKAAGLFAPASPPAPRSQEDRRLFLRRTLAGCGAMAIGAGAFRDLALHLSEPGLGVGFRNDAPDKLDAFSRPADFQRTRGEFVQCSLCPHQCILGDNDRGFCRTRVVKNGHLHTVAYGNLCAMAVDPMEKKPLYHFLPQTPILSVAVGGCNLRCLNCQNWEISQARPADVATQAATPEQLVQAAGQQGIGALAYTYSEPLMAYEYVRDTAARARSARVKNVLVTAGYVNEEPLRQLCRVIDAVTLDVKAFRESFYRKVSGGRLRPVLRTLEVLREEKVWTEVSFLMVPSLSDDAVEIGEFASWVAGHLGAGVPFHILRFHPAHRLGHLPWTEVEAMEAARRRAMDAGLSFVYLGNVPGHDANHTRCPRDQRLLIERQGFHVTRNLISNGRCPCGEPIPGVFEA